MTKTRCKNLNCNKRYAPIVGDCVYCKSKFCLKHRLPEDHVCDKIKICKTESFNKNKQVLLKEASNNQKNKF